MAALAVAVYLTAGAQPQVLLAHGHKGALRRGVYPVLLCKLLVPELRVEPGLLLQRLPALRIGDVASAVGIIDREHRRGVGAHRAVREIDCLLRAPVFIATYLKVEVLVLLPADDGLCHIVPGDEHLYRADGTAAYGAVLELCQHLPGLVILEQRTRRDDERRALRIEVLRQGIKPCVSFRHSVPP